MCGKLCVEIEKFDADNYHVQLLGNRALKILPKVTRYEEGNFDREVEICSLLALEGHKNIVKVFAVHDMGRNYVIEMERLKPLAGRDNKDWTDQAWLLRWAMDQHCYTYDQELKNLNCEMSRRNFTQEQCDLVHAAHLKVWTDVSNASEYLGSLGWRHVDQATHNFMQDADGNIKMIDFDRVRALEDC